MIGLLYVVIITLITVIGGKVYMDNKEKGNIENQRLAALTLRKEEPHATKVIFKFEGGQPGIGVPWVAGAEVTMGGETFKYNLETDNSERVVFSNLEEAEKYDEITNKELSQEYPLEVIYSNGEHEVLK